MKNLKFTFIGLSILGLVACNSGSDGGQPAPEPSPDPVVLESLPYTYTTNYATGVLTNNLPTVDLLPMGAGARVTFTFTNPYSEKGIWFYAYRNGEADPWFQGISPFEIIEPAPGDIYFTYTKPKSSTDCANYTQQNPLPGGQSCTLTRDIMGMENLSNTENIVLTQNMTYGIDDPSNPLIGYKAKVTTVKVFAKSGIWYKGLPNYNGWLTALHVLHESGNDYIYETRPAESTQIGKIKATFDESGVAQINYANIESCTLNGCVNGIIPVNGYNVYLTANYGESYTIGVGGYDAFDHVNYELKTLDGTNITRDCLDSRECPKTVFSQVFAVQPDGTIVGKNRNGTFGCSNRDGSNYRVISKPSDVNFGYYDSMSSSLATITYGHTNWIIATRVYESGIGLNPQDKFYYKVNADVSGTCELDTINPILSDAMMDTRTAITQQAQITPNGVYGFAKYNDADLGIGFYKYLPREYMRN